MFDEIDFLDPSSRKNKPKRKEDSAPVDMVVPEIEKKIIESKTIPARGQSKWEAFQAFMEGKSAKSPSEEDDAAVTAPKHDELPSGDQAGAREEISQMSGENRNVSQEKEEHDQAPRAVSEEKSEILQERMETERALLGLKKNTLTKRLPSSQWNLSASIPAHGTPSKKEQEINRGKKSGAAAQTSTQVVGQSGKSPHKKKFSWVKGVAEKILSGKRKRETLPEQQKNSSEQIVAASPDIRAVDEVVDKAYRTQGLLAHQETAKQEGPAKKRMTIPRNMFSVASENEDIPEVNLLPGKEEKRFNIAVSMPLTVTVGLALWLGVGGGGLWYRIRQREGAREMVALQQSVVRLQNELQSYDSLTEGIVMYRRMDVVQKVLAQQTHWLPFISLLEEKALPDVSYDDLQATKEGSATLSIIAPSFAKAASQVAAYAADPRILKVTVTAMEGVLNEDEEVNKVTFGLAFEFDQRILYPNSDIKPAVPGQ